MAARFPQEKGKATGIYYSAGGIATFTIPLITARISEMSIAHIMWFDTGIAAAGFLLALFIGYRWAEYNITLKQRQLRNKC